jgi:hypothetical protein
VIQTTIKTALYGTVEGYAFDETHVIYIIREGDTVFYIGQSQEPLLRLEQHLTAGFIGQLMRDFWPLSAHWQVDLLTFADGAQILDTTGMDPKQSTDRMIVERALIQHYKPCCNIANNPTPSCLPERYRKDELEIGLTDDLY